LGKLKGINAKVSAQVEEFARAEAKRFVLRIKRQQFPDFHAVPLSPAYALKKRLLGLDGRTMIATKHYVENIVVIPKVTKKGAVYHIGFPEGMKARDHKGKEVDITLNEVAYVQEHGSATRNIPQRKHWSVHLRDLAERATLLRIRLVREVVRTLKPR
jgi:hypothetical protein